MTHQKTVTGFEADQPAIRVPEGSTVGYANNLAGNRALGPGAPTCTCEGVKPARAGIL